MLTLEALKLATTGDDLPRVEQALLDMANKGHEARATLRSTYYDTVAGRLRREGVVLCVHEQDRRYIQTVKTDGISGSTFRRRGEWEDVIGAEQPDLDAPNSGPRLPAGLYAAELRARFTTLHGQRVIAELSCLLNYFYAKHERGVGKGNVTGREMLEDMVGVSHVCVRA